MSRDILSTILYVLPLVSLALTSLQSYRNSVKANERLTTLVEALRKDVSELKQDWKKDHDEIVRLSARVDAAWRWIDSFKEV